MSARDDAVLSLREIVAEAPAIHGEAGAGDLITHGLTEGALEFIERHVARGHRTLETGAGYSTILLAAIGAEHLCLVPNAQEVSRIEGYLDAKGVSRDALTFHVATSERVLPTLETGPLDLVLVDGSHSFPQVFIDWFFTAAALKVGGHLLVDDVHVWTGRVLRDFLRAEPEWTLVDEVSGRTAIFRKVAEVDPDKLWVDQPYVRRRSATGVRTPARMALSMLRHGHREELVRTVRARIGW